MTKYVICNAARADWGKSASLLKLIDSLNQYIIAEPYKYGGDKTVICSIEGKHILIQTQGDPNTTAFEDTELYIKSHPEMDIQLYICATRSRVGQRGQKGISPLEKARNIAEKYFDRKIIYFRNFYLFAAYKIEEEQLNSASVEGIRNLIKSLLNIKTL